MPRLVLVLLIVGIVLIGRTGALQASNAADLVVAEGPLRAMDCRTGRTWDAASAPFGPSVFVGVAPNGTAHRVSADGSWWAGTLPDLRTRFQRRLPCGPTAAALSQPDAHLLAVACRPDSSGQAPLSIFDAHDGKPLHSYRTEPAGGRVSTLAVAPLRGSFVAGVEFPSGKSEVWELSWREDAAPVFKGLVHDYRMGEAIALPGKFTERVAPAASPTVALTAGAHRDEWLRVDRDGALHVLHLEVRRELARFDPLPRSGGPGSKAGVPVAAAWRNAHGRGWLLGLPGQRELWRISTGDRLRLESAGPLPGALVAVATYGHRPIEHAAVVLLVRNDDGKLAWGRLNPGVQALPDVRWHELADAASLLRAPGGSCVAVLDAGGNWLAAISD